MEDYTIEYKSIVEKLGVSKNVLLIIVLILFSPIFAALYLKAFDIIVYLIIFVGFLLLLNGPFIIPSFIKIKYKIKISNDGISFYYFAPSLGYRFPRFEKKYVQFSNVVNFKIKKHSLVLHYGQNYGFFNSSEKSEISNLTSKECVEINTILLQKIGNKNNARFRQPFFSLIFQDQNFALILIIIITIAFFMYFLKIRF